MSDTARNFREIKKVGHIVAKLKSMDLRVEDAVPLGPRIGQMLSQDVARQFSTAGQYMGKPWRPLSPATIADKIRKGFPVPKPLERTKELKLSFVGRPMQAEKYTPHALFYGSTLDKAKWQQRGTFRHGRRHIPPRTILSITPYRRAEIRKLVVKYVAKGKV